MAQVNHGRPETNQKVPSLLWFSATPNVFEAVLSANNLTTHLQMVLGCIWLSLIFGKQIVQIRFGQTAGEAFFAQDVGDGLSFALLQLPDFLFHRAW
jgi:hypothetical protein